MANNSVGGHFDFVLAGVDFNLPGNGGKECSEFLSLTQRLIESGLSCLFAVYLFWCTYSKLKLPPLREDALNREMDYWGKRVMLLCMCLTFGIELGFKFATRQMIWIFNPCHVASIVQIYLLAAPPRRYVTGIFRFHMHMLTGAPIALLFPVVNTRLLPFEAETYYIQHILMLVIPFYLMRMGGVYIPEQLGDFSWALMTLGFQIIYHFVPLQTAALISHVNLNNMLCPAISDPFHGPYYRLCAISHQVILIPTLGKIYAWAAQYFNIRPKHDYCIEEPWLVSSTNTTNGKISNVTNRILSGNKSEDVKQINGHLKAN
ncbi:transmembrane protein 164 [Patella vulgata]|uniref:transmembrane protein 164 n=1 Tax=Patella vulgata TaxID=6465 RepID=UPI00217FF67C|nr:transmembrane protein 164 [Patella vulgata]